MPGQKINARQIEVYMKAQKKGNTKSTAATVGGFSERSAYNVEKRNYQVAKSKRTWKTRQDPLAEVWESELVPMLEQKPQLLPITLLCFLQDKHPDKYPDNIRRTLERRVKKWRAHNGPDKEVIFRQKHPPGWQGLSDFTPATRLEVTINGQKIEHNLYHYRLAYSGWEYASVILGGESYTALAESLQNALWQSGGVPETHRTDSLSAAFKNLSPKEADDLTHRYEEFCCHYGMEATRNNRGVSHENGTIESSHRHLKTRIDQALVMRGSRDFSHVNDYRQFVHEIVNKHNRRVNKLYLEELATLKELPERRTIDFTEERVPVSKLGTIRVKQVPYTVPSRLIGMVLKVHLYDDRLECFVGGDYVVTLTRIRNGKGSLKGINYRHVIHSLVRKPHAFLNYIYQEAMFPTLAFRETWGRLCEAKGSRTACKEYVRILKEASVEDREERVNRHLEDILAKDELPTADQVRKLFPTDQQQPVFRYSHDDLASYGELLRKGGAQ